MTSQNEVRIQGGGTDLDWESQRTGPGRDWTMKCPNHWIILSWESETPDDGPRSHSHSDPAAGELQFLVTTLIVFLPLPDMLFLPGA